MNSDLAFPYSKLTVTLREVRLPSLSFRFLSIILSDHQDQENKNLKRAPITTKQEQYLILWYFYSTRCWGIFCSSLTHQCTITKGVANCTKASKKLLKYRDVNADLSWMETNTAMSFHSWQACRCTKQLPKNKLETRRSEMTSINYARVRKKNRSAGDGKEMNNANSFQRTHRGRAL